MLREVIERIVNALIACEGCDQLHRRRPLRPGARARCGRCGGELYASTADALERALALNVASLALLLVANAALFMHVSLEGHSQSNRIYSGVLDLADFGYAALATLILFTTIFAPLAKILATLYAVSAAYFRWSLPGVAVVMRSAETLSTWSMLEVYLLAVIVAVVKLSMMATVQLEVGCFAFFALILSSTAANGALEPEAVWSRLRRA